MTQPIDDILIVGGGTAGWITAAYLAKTLGTAAGGVRITLVESSDVGIIGVGEGTIPTILNTLRTIGIDEARFMRGANATFKQGVKFVNWTYDPAEGRPDSYYHAFSYPHQLKGKLDLAPYWLAGCAGDTVFSDAITMQDKVCEAGRGPKQASDGQYQGRMGYAYHFDAGKLAVLMQEVGQELGVRRLVGHVENVILDEDGAIASVETREHGSLKAGLYIDCTGFAGVLIGKAMGVPWIDKSNVLFVDRALAMQVPYDRPDAPIRTATISTAHECGWTWDIGLPERRGIGYVFSSNHTDETRAEEVLRNYIGPQADSLEPRLLKLRIGHREQFWKKNCVAIGLSGGFLEPLESTGILLIEVAAWMLSRSFPRSGRMEAPAEMFNKAMMERYRGSIDFIKMHFCLSQRTDSDFWIDNRRPESIPDSLQNLLEMWRERPPNAFDFPTVHTSFEYFNFQFILYGMRYATQVAGNMAAYPRMEEARMEFERLRQGAARAIADLPDHRALVEQVYAHGFGTGLGGAEAAASIGRATRSVTSPMGRAAMPAPL